MEELVSIYNEVLEHDNKDKGIRLFIFKNKADFVKKYVEENLMKFKIDEPNHGEKYEDTYKTHLESINMVVKPFSEDEVIIVGVFGRYVDRINIGKDDVRIYNLKDIEFLLKDINKYYQ